MIRLIFLIFLSLFNVIYAQEFDIDDPDIIAKLSEIEESEYIEMDDSEAAKPTLVDIETTELEEDESLPLKETKFGYDFFLKMPTSIAATPDLPVPSDYEISLNDEVTIIFSGTKKNIYNLKVGLDGSILIPEIGEVSIAGKTFEETRNILEDLVETSYVGSKISFSISNLSSRKINIIGAVEIPGTYIVNPFTTITSALAYGGGLKDYASLRNIKLIKSDGTTFYYDLYDLLINGERLNDVSLSAGDTIVVGGTSNFVKIDGEVIRPQIYEYSPNDKFSDLINFTLGFDRLANTDSISVNYLSAGQIQTKKANLTDQIGDTKILDIFVGSLTEIKNKNIFVNGDTVSSGYFDIKDNNSFKDFLGNLSFSDNVYPFFAIYKTFTNFGQSSKDYYFSLADESTYSDLVLLNNSELLFFSRSDMLESSDIESLDDYLVNGISVVLPDDIFRIPVVGKVSPRMINSFIGENTYNSSLDESIVITDSDVYLNAYDKTFDASNILSISVPPNKAELISVEISGQVKRPGIYSISAGSSLHELYAIAGGILESADDTAISFFRETVKESQIRALNLATAIISQQILLTKNSDTAVDLESFLALSDLYEPQGRISGDYSVEGLNSKEMILRNNDVIFVPTFSNEVILHGEVNNNSAIMYDPNTSLNDYIDRAGGFTDFANEKGIYVIRANGSSVKVSTNIFLDGDIPIARGDTIVVPRKVRNFDAINTVSLATKIISDIAFSAASLNAIQN